MVPHTERPYEETTRTLLHHLQTPCSCVPRSWRPVVRRRAFADGYPRMLLATH